MNILHHKNYYTYLVINFVEILPELQFIMFLVIEFRKNWKIIRDHLSQSLIVKIWFLAVVRILILKVLIY